MRLTLARKFDDETGAAAQLSSAVLFVEGDRHSFVDDSLIDRSLTTELDLRQQPPDHDFGAMAPLVAADAPWEKNCQVGAYSSIHQDTPGGNASLFYQLYCSKDANGSTAYGADSVAMVAVAQSTDGIHFSKPIVGKIRFRNSTTNNIVMLPPGKVSAMSELEGCSVFRDPHSGRLTSVAALGTKLSVWTALDKYGLEWNLTARWEVGFDDSQSALFWDHPRSEYALYTRAKSGDTATERSEVRGVRRLPIRSLDDPGLPARKNLWDNDFGQTVLMPDAIDNATHVRPQRVVP